MRSNILALMTMALTGLFATVVRADDTTEWFAVYYPEKEGGYSFLDSDKSNVVTNRLPNADSVDSGDDKGLRWKFLSGKGTDGYIATQAHQDHIVGYDASDNEFHADFKTSNHDTAVMAHFINDSAVTLCYNDNCIGAGGKKTTDKEFVWSIKQVQKV